MNPQYPRSRPSSSSICQVPPELPALPYPIPLFFSPILSYRIDEALLPFRHFLPLFLPISPSTRPWLIFANCERQIVLKHELPLVVFSFFLDDPPFLLLPSLSPFFPFFFPYSFPPPTFFLLLTPRLSLRPWTIGRKVFSKPSVSSFARVVFTHSVMARHETHEHSVRV